MEMERVIIDLIALLARSMRQEERGSYELLEFVGQVGHLDGDTVRAVLIVLAIAVSAALTRPIIKTVKAAFNHTAVKFGATKASLFGRRSAYQIHSLSHISEATSPVSSSASGHGE
jgi:hypothetical protein